MELNFYANFGFGQTGSDGVDKIKTVKLQFSYWNPLMKSLRQSLKLIEGERKVLEYQALKAFGLTDEAFEALLESLRSKGKLSLISCADDSDRPHPLPPDS